MVEVFLLVGTLLHLGYVAQDPHQLRVGAALPVEALQGLERLEVVGIAGEDVPPVGHGLVLVLQIGFLQLGQSAFDHRSGVGLLDLAHHLLVNSGQFFEGSGLLGQPLQIFADALVFEVFPEGPAGHHERQGFLGQLFFVDLHQLAVDLQALLRIVPAGQANLHDGDQLLEIALGAVNRLQHLGGLQPGGFVGQHLLQNGHAARIADIALQGILQGGHPYFRIAQLEQLQVGHPQQQILPDVPLGFPDRLLGAQLDLPL